MTRFIDHAGDAADGGVFYVLNGSCYTTKVAFFSLHAADSGLRHVLGRRLWSVAE
jgi:hypothetical protein